MPDNHVSSRRCSFPCFPLRKQTQFPSSFLAGKMRETRPAKKEMWVCQKSHNLQEPPAPQRPVKAIDQLRAELAVLHTIGSSRRATQGISPCRSSEGSPARSVVSSIVSKSSPDRSNASSPDRSNASSPIKAAIPSASYADLSDLVSPRAREVAAGSPWGGSARRGSSPSSPEREPITRFASLRRRHSIAVGHLKSTTTIQPPPSGAMVEIGGQQREACLAASLSLISKTIN
ncbi:hypothetical protein T484DRAFT_2195778 [Baffinella frigidus]|nr:hypothetical protein T484DRAFT_2195778 [Cryptophyta sp. CCMP2293]